jgi:hypothetical protein
MLRCGCEKTDPQSNLCATLDSDAKFIRLHNQLLEKSLSYVIVICDPTVEPTNNRSERAARFYNHNNALHYSNAKRNSVIRSNVFSGVFATNKVILTVFVRSAITF